MIALRTPPEILVGRGVVAEVPRLAAALEVARPLIVTDPGVAAAGAPARLRELLAGSGFEVEVWDGVAPDPDEGHAEACAARLWEDDRDAVIAVGGGSVLDAAKLGAVLAVQGGRAADRFGLDRVTRPGLPLLAVPTTTGGGGEVSSHAVLLGGAPRRKRVVSGPPLLPRAAVIDPELALTLPPEPTLYSALDGLVHAVEAFVARRASRWTDAWVRAGWPAIVAALPRVATDGGDLAAREELAVGCLGASLAMANASAGAAHALGYPLTERYGVPHGLANALMVPEVVARYAREAEAGPRGKLAELACGLDPGAHGLPEAEAAALLPELLRVFFEGLGVDHSLVRLGGREEDLEELAEAAREFRPVLENSPVDLALGDLLEIYRRAWEAAPERREAHGRGSEVAP